MERLAVLLVIFVTCSAFKIPENNEDIFIRCSFSGTDPYTCDLFINNPNGDEFAAIEGEHLAGKTNDDVEMVTGIFQNTQNIPEIICSSFPNLIEIFLEESFLEVLTPSSFAACANIEMLFLGMNLISTISDGIFTNNPNLNTLMLFRNNIQEISDNAFTGSGISMLELDFNHISTINPNWLAPIRDTLEVLTLSSNNLTESSKEGFGELPNLHVLDLSGNDLRFLMPDAFLGLTNLTDLWLNRIGIDRIYDRIFEGLTNLQNIRMSHNSLRQLPRNLFDGLTNLHMVDVSHNQLTELNLNSFGSSITSVFEIMADFNAITSVDSQIIQQADTLYYLFLNSNLCVDRNFYGVNNNRGMVTSQLETCIVNFGFIDCFFIGFGGEDYVCIMNVQNPTGRNSFDQITGDHEANKSDQDVTSVSAMLMHTLNVPSIICDQFNNLQELSIRYSRVEVISVEDFMYCHNMKQLNLESNLIRHIPDVVLGKKMGLEVVNFNDNQISTIGSSPFIYSSLREISLQNNLLSEFEPSVFTEVNETLTHLFLSGNQLTSLPSAAFSDFGVLRFLSLNANQLRIPSDAFRGARNLFYLNLGENQLTELDAEWFTDLTSLESLRLYSNNLEDLSADIFNNLQSITDIDISRNQLQVINSPSFGNSLTTLTNIFFEGNRINFIDPDFLNNASSLDYLFLSGNLCADFNFMNVRNNLEVVRNSLSRCKTNFIGFVRCTYLAPDIQYTCDLETMNLFGRDDFEIIEGDHRENHTNIDVVTISATNQHSRTIPSILCRTFTNTRELIFEYSQVEEISRSSFENCQQLTFIGLSLNRITEIPDETFSGNSNLRQINAFFNRISRVSNTAFAGTFITDIDLDYNRISEYNRETFDVVAGTLKALFLSDNLIGSLPDGAFNALGQLEVLNLANNPTGNLPSDAFHSMINLHKLIIHDCDISELSPDQFQGLNSLKDLQLAGNHLTELPDLVFNQLWNLTEIDLDFNQLYTIPASAFGTTVSTIQYLFFLSNNVFGVDSLFFDNASELRWLFLSGNICTQRDFMDVLTNREAVRSMLNECLMNFNITEAIRCNFIQSGDSYYCLMNVFNPGGRMNFESIEGNHLEGRGDLDVTEIYAINQNTRVVPEIVCSSYENLLMLFITNSRLTFLSPTSFENCGNLEILVLNYNHIASIPDGFFLGTPNLYVMQIVSNLVENIGRSAFTGSSLVLLDLSDNRLTEFDSTPFEAVNSTLLSLILPYNQISSISENSFSNLRNLEILQLNYNPLNNNLPSFAFSSLWRLKSLTLINCGLTELDSTWFYGLTTLNNIHLSFNGFSQLPNDVFGSLYGVQLINVASNNLEIIDASSLGYIYPLIQSIYAYDNKIQAVDPRLLSDNSNLDTLMLNRNLCVDQDFVNVTGNRELVRSDLEECFTNFQPLISCSFIDGDPYYECNLAIQNPAGVDNMQEITGDHFYDRTDADVGFVQIYRQNTRNLPSIVCRTFPNLEEIYIASSNFMQLDSSTFDECTNLGILFITSNTIQTVPPRSFAQNHQLELIYLRFNQISSLNAESFIGAPLKRIFLDGNRLTEVDASWFVPVNETLDFLELSFNGIEILTANSLGELGNVEYLYFDGNNFNSIGENSFAGLRKINLIALRDSRITEFSPSWFSADSPLKYLYLDGNLINSLPIGAFDTLSELILVNLNRNQLTVLNSNSFGRALRTLTGFYAMNNEINAIDATIFDEIENLQNLFLYNNVCVNQNFLGVMNTIESVRNSLEVCFNNF